jgi:hypothetical protein
VATLSGLGVEIRTFMRMRKAPVIRVIAASVALVVMLVIVPSAMAASAVDQYSEGIPTAGGQKPSRDVVRSHESGGPGGTTTIPPATRAQLEKSKNGSAAVKAAKITAPSRTDLGRSDSSSGGGLGLLLPLILVAALVAAVGIFFARRRAGPAPS